MRARDLRSIAMGGIEAAVRAARLVRSPLLMAATIALLEVLSPTPYNVPPATRGLVYLLVVIVAATADGAWAAVATAAVAVAYSALTPHLIGRRVDGVGLLLLTLTALVTSVLVGRLRDRIRHKDAELQLEHARVRETLSTKAEFMNAAAHELRTPLTVITGYLSMLQEGNFGPAPQRWNAVVDILLRKAHELSLLVEQMLVSARVESGTIATATLDIDLRNAVREAVERANPRATLLYATLQYQLPSRPVIVRADPDQLATILDNLINNALSYTDATPWVRVTVVDEVDAQVLVEDRGRGVPEEMRERIFERFVRVIDPERRQVPGTGLGLAISRDLAERQGGSLTLAQSDMRLGSVFVLRLPHAGPGPAGRPEFRHSVAG